MKSQVSRFRPASQILSTGFTLIELLIVMIIVAIGIALAVPSYENIAQKRQTTAEAEQLAAFLGLARSEAVKRNEQIGINFSYTDSTNWCVGAAIGTTYCDCTKPSTHSLYCGIDGASHIMSNSDFSKSKMVTSSAATDGYFDFAFDPIRGSMSATDLANSLAARNFVIESENADFRLLVEVTVVGRIRICNPVSTQKVPGYPDCV